jgi:hypothetical protein
MPSFRSSWARKEVRVRRRPGPRVQGERGSRRREGTRWSEGEEEATAVEATYESREEEV